MGAIPREDRLGLRIRNTRRYIQHQLLHRRPLDPYYILRVLEGKKA